MKNRNSNPFAGSPRPAKGTQNNCKGIATAAYLIQIGIDRTAEAALLEKPHDAKPADAARSNISLVDLAAAQKIRRKLLKQIRK